MDLRGTEGKYEALQAERTRLEVVTLTAGEEAQRCRTAAKAFRIICKAAEWHGGKGPRSVTDPIVLKNVLGGQLVARVGTFDRHGEACDNSRAVGYETSVYFNETGVRARLLGQEYFDSQHWRDEVGQTLAMLIDAFENPELNPQLHQQFAPLPQE